MPKVKPCAFRNTCPAQAERNGRYCTVHDARKVHERVLKLVADAKKDWGDELGPQRWEQVQWLENQFDTLIARIKETV